MRSRARIQEPGDLRRAVGTPGQDQEHRDRVHANAQQRVPEGAAQQRQAQTALNRSMGQLVRSLQASKGKEAGLQNQLSSSSSR